MLTWLTIAAALLFAQASTGENVCTEARLLVGLCHVATANIHDNEAVLEGTGSTTSPGAPGGSPGGAGSGAPGPGGSGTAATPCAPGDDLSTPECDPHDGYDVTVVTLADIARFRPSPGIQRMEPDGWVVVGLPANVYSLVERQLVPGTLLGMSAEVRFTPVAWRWDYGDGTHAVLPTKGGTWAALGLREFDATPTSHVYRASGEYTIRLDIVYRAEYRLDGGAFTPIAGTLALPANELRITAGGAKTVLVDRDCLASPRGPGC